MAPPESPYRALQRRCKAAGLPANRSAVELEKLLAENETATNGSSSEKSPPRRRSTQTAGGKKAGGSGLASGEWRPDYPVRYAPLFPFVADVVTLHPTVQGAVDLFWWVFGYPGFLWPWNAIYLTVCYLSHTYTTPDVSRCATFAPDWIAELFLRNLVLLWVFAGGWHVLLYTFKAQGSERKYDPKWQATGSKKFLFGDQVYDNVFWSCTSGVATWTAYEAFALHMWANENDPNGSALYTDWWSRPVYSVAWLLLIPIWREFHFYAVHRALHWKPVYRWVHYLHHKNVNPGPWSGLSMHPVEHMFYFSVVLVHFVLPSHPIHFFFNSQHTALTPAGGHHGFEGPVCDGKIPTGSYFHYLHHRYFECNYGEATIPLDKLFGTFRDGTPDGYGASLRGKEIE